MAQGWHRGGTGVAQGWHAGGASTVRRRWHRQATVVVYVSCIAGWHRWHKWHKWSYGKEIQ